MDTNQLKAKLKSGDISGVYILGGEEEYLIRYYLGQIIEAVGADSPFAVFNNQFFDGEEVDFAALAEAVKSPPMMDEYKLIVWRHASFTSMKEKDLELLSELCHTVAENRYAVVAFSAIADGIDFGTPKRPSKFFTKFDKCANLLRFDKSTEAQLYAWLKKHFDAVGVMAGADAIRALVFRAGRSMEVLSREVEKLSALVLSRGEREVKVSHVEEVASSTPECDTFALSTAISERNKAMAFEALEDMRHRRVDPTVIMGMMAKTYSELLAVAGLLDDGLGASDIEGVLKMNTYRLKHVISAAKRYGSKRLSEIVSYLARVDADSKFGGITGYTAVELFISQNI